MKNYSILMLLSYPFLLQAQESINGKVAVLHPSVGEVISLDEKNKFSLFPEYGDTLFKSAMLIEHPDHTYAFLIKPQAGKGKSFEKPIGKEDMAIMYQKIERMQPMESAAAAAPKYYTAVSKEEKTIQEGEVSKRSRWGARFLDWFFIGIIDALFNSSSKDNQNADSNSNTASGSDNKKEDVYAPRGDGKSKGNREDGEKRKGR